MVLSRAAIAAIALSLTFAPAWAAGPRGGKTAEPPRIEGDAAPDEPAVAVPRVPANPRANPADHDVPDPDDEMVDAEPNDPGERYQTDGSDQDNDAEDDRRMAEARRRPYQIDTVSGAALRIDAPTLPDLSRYTAANAAAKIKRKPLGSASVGSMLTELSFKGFMGADERMREWAARQSSLPKVIFVRGGYVTPSDIARQVPKQYFEETSRGVFVARLPIDVAPGATLHIDRADFRLSLDRGAFLVNEGKLFVTDSRLRAWNEKKKEPAYFSDKHDFRPFLVSWGGSQTYLVKSVVAHLDLLAA